METRNIFENLSPLDHRYYLSNRKVFESLSDCFSEEASIKYCIKVEAALLKTLLEICNEGDDEVFALVDRLASEIKPDEVYAEEEKTQHNIRALVNVIKAKLPERVHRFVHLGATSVDILDTAKSMAYRDGVRGVILPLLTQTVQLLITLVEEHKGLPQVGRTHGQFAVPITLGFALAEYVARLGKSVVRIEELSSDLRGKLAGAVGAYNALSMITADPQELERRFLSELALFPSEHSTQMVEPEHILRLLLEVNVAFGVIANLADDLRHLQRSEISEVREYFSSTQVGSSTMPQKRNPWNCEHIKSLWKAFSPRVTTFYMDQISEHQRDLTNSASSRFAAEFIAGFAAATARLNKVLSGLSVDEEQLNNNIENAGDMVLAEAAYILLAMGGEPDAHEKIRVATLECEKENITLVSALRKDNQAWNTLSAQLKKVNIDDADEFFSKPELYLGRAPQKAEEIVNTYKIKISNFKESL